MAKEDIASGELLKEQKTTRELEAMARQRLGCAVPVRRDVKGGSYFQVIEVIRARFWDTPTPGKLLSEELGHLYDLKE